MNATSSIALLEAPPTAACSAHAPPVCAALPAITAPCAANDSDAPRSVARPVLRGDTALEGAGTTPEATLPSLLLIDDEQPIVRVLTRFLRKRWNVTPANSGAEALRALASNPAFDAIVCDLMMPGMNGIDLALEVESALPVLRARMLFLTGGAVTPDAEEFVARADVRWLPKPVDFRALESALAPLRPESR